MRKIERNCDSYFHIAFFSQRRKKKFFNKKTDCSRQCFRFGSLIILVTDMKAKSCYAVDSKQIPWVPINGKINLINNQQTVELFSFDKKVKNNKEMTLEETIKCKDRVPGNGLNDYYCRNKNCECL